MLVLFDQGTPVPIRKFLKGHIVETAAQRGWDTLKNGELLRKAEEAGFNVLLTPDKNIRYQQIWRFAPPRLWSWPIPNGQCFKCMSIE